MKFIHISFAPIIGLGFYNPEIHHHKLKKPVSLVFVIILCVVITFRKRIKK